MVSLRDNSGAGKKVVRTFQDGRYTGGGKVRPDRRERSALMATVTKAPGHKAPRPVYYPESDGKPIGETDTHVRYMMDVRTALEHYFRERPDVYVSGNNMMYYVEGDPRK